MSETYYLGSENSRSAPKIRYMRCPNPDNKILDSSKQNPDSNILNFGPDIHIRICTFKIY